MLLAVCYIFSCEQLRHLNFSTVKLTYSLRDKAQNLKTAVYSFKMALDESDFTQRKLSGWGWVKWFTFFMIRDIICYGIVMPVLAITLAGFIRNRTISYLDTEEIEFILTVTFTVIFVNIAYSLCGETFFWEHLFAFEVDASRMLQIRDFINVGILFGTLYCLLDTIVLIITVDKGIHADHLGEGLSLFIFKKLGCESYLETFGLGYKSPHANVMNPFGKTEMEKVERGGAFIFLWAMLTACVTKVLYFNTLYTYLRSMEIFLSLRPTFEDNDSYYDYDERSFHSRRSMLRYQSRMDGNVARRLKENVSSTHN